MSDLNAARRAWEAFAVVSAPENIGVLDGWDEVKSQFVKVMPVEYRKVLAAAHLDTDAARVAAV